MSKMKKKLSSQKGETILETLVALLIIVLSISFLSASIAKSASISNDIKKATEDGFSYAAGSKKGEEPVSSSTDNVMSSREVSVYEVSTEAGTFLYYEPHIQAPEG